MKPLLKCINQAQRSNAFPKDLRGLIVPVSSGPPCALLLMFRWAHKALEGGPIEREDNCRYVAGVRRGSDHMCCSGSYDKKHTKA